MRQIIAIATDRYVVVEQDGDRLVLQRLPGDFRAVRLVLGMTQTQMAEAMGISRGYLARIERGDYAPPSLGVSLLLSAFPSLSDAGLSCLTGLPIAGMTNDSTEARGMRQENLGLAFGSRKAPSNRPRASQLANLE